jgi:nicotinamide-nucleotide amidase
MKAWIIAVGSELLTPFRVDTNSLLITDRLNAIGIDVLQKSVIGDDVDRVAALLTEALAAADLVVCTGGLGPTADDVTRDAVSRALGLPLDPNPEILAAIEARFVRRGLVMSAINRRQAMVPRGALVLDNVNGTAPGLWIEARSSRLALLPGPPREMTPMLEALVRERLAPLTGGGGLFRRVLKITGRAESEVDALAQPIYGPLRGQAVPIETTILAVFGQVELHLTAAAQSRAEADAALNPAVAALVAGLGPSVYSTDGTTLEAVVGDLLRASGDTVAAAESCSGGLLMSRLTDVPGSSDYIQSGVVCYSNRSKTEWVGVPADLIAAHGAVSEPVARAMAEGVRLRAGATVGIGVTGIAGPGGGTPDKPVGTVCLAVLTEHQAHVRTVRLVGNREQVKYQSAQAALNLLRLMLLKCL